jgi:hypothetical protein
MKKKNIAGMIGAIMSVVVLSGCSNIQLNYDIDGNTVSEETKETAIEASTAEVEKEDAEATSKSSVEDEVANESEPEDVSVDVSNDISGYDSAEMMDGEALSEAELNQLQEYLNQPDNYGFTVSSYKTPDEIDMDWVFAYGAGIKNCDYSEEALNAYLEADDEFDSVEYDVIALAGDDVRSLIEAKTGIADYDVSTIDGYTYVEEYDILFSQVSDYYDKDLICYEGVKNDNLIQIVYKVGSQDNRRRITLVDTKNSENPYTYCSNRELWEENAETTTEVRNLDTDETVTCAIVKIPKGHMIEVIKDNEVAASAEARIRKVDVTQYDDIKEIAISDVNGDEIGDMIVILSDGTDTIAVVCRGWENEWDGAGYVVGENAVTEWLSANVSDLTVENVVSYIKDHQEEFMSL